MKMNHHMTTEMRRNMYRNMSIHMKMHINTSNKVTLCRQSRTCNIITRKDRMYIAVSSSVIEVVVHIDRVGSIVGGVHLWSPSALSRRDHPRWSPDVESLKALSL